MTLHVSSTGKGAPLVMLHGWGMHGGIWGNVAGQLAQRFRVHCVDMPGYGHSTFPSHIYGKGPGRGQEITTPLPLPLSRKQERGVELLDEIVEHLSAKFTEPLFLCGWSLGGQVALRWAMRFPEQVKKLALVATTPCFVQRADWQCAIASEVLQEFAGALEQNYVLTLKRFIALQVRGSENERELLQTLRARAADGGEPDMAALRQGLAILRDTDLRGNLAQIAQQTLVIAGERDTLTPPAATAYLARALPNARMVQTHGAAHAPFLSHSDEFVKQVTEFLADS